MKPVTNKEYLKSVLAAAQIFKMTMELVADYEWFVTKTGAHDYTVEAYHPVLRRMSARIKEVF